MDDLKNIDQIFSYSKLKDFIDENPRHFNKAKDYLTEIRANYKQRMIDLIGKTLDYSLSKIYDGIDVQVDSSVDLDDVVKNNTVIFVPNHQSHADYLVFNYVLHRNFNLKAFIAGGINLNVFPIGKIFREAGCFFIRRTFNNNQLYKLVLEAYIHFLIMEDIPLEFFYEGGRSRTGKLMAPKFGLFQMILDAHEGVKENRKPLAFVPISIVHEIVPEHKSLVKLMEGGKKKKESFTQVMKVFKFLRRRFGSVYLKVGKPISYRNEIQDKKKRVQYLAFDCYRGVGHGMTLTGQALLSLIFLDGPKSSLTLNEVFDRAFPIINYCHKFHIPLAKTLLGHEEEVKASIKNALNLYLKNDRVKLVKNKLLREEYYVLKENLRMESLFSKNSILHHFIAPFLINMAWVGVFNGRIMNLPELESFLNHQRERLKFEFYLPTVKELYRQAVKIISECIGREVDSLEECFMLTTQEMHSIAHAVIPFGGAFRHIYEAYYITAEALRFFKDREFDTGEFVKVGRELFEVQKKFGRLVKHGESFALPTIKNALKYLINKGTIQVIESCDEENDRPERYKIADITEIDRLRAIYARDLTDLLFLNFETFPVSQK